MKKRLKIRHDPSSPSQLQTYLDVQNLQFENRLATRNGNVYIARDTFGIQHALVWKSGCLERELPFLLKVGNSGSCFVPKVFGGAQVCDSQYLLDMEVLVSAGEAIERDLVDSSTFLGKALEAAVYLLHALCSLRSIHQHAIVHGDLSPANILFSESENVWKIVDFNLSQFNDSLQPKNAGTKGFQAPEVLESGLVSERSDIFSLGMTVKRYWMDKWWMEMVIFRGSREEIMLGQAVDRIVALMIKENPNERDSLGDLIIRTFELIEQYACKKRKFRFKAIDRVLPIVEICRTQREIAETRTQTEITEAALEKENIKQNLLIDLK